MTYISLPLVALDAAGLRVPERITSTVEVDLTSSLRVTSDYKKPKVKTMQIRPYVNHGWLTGDDRDAGAVLGDQTAGVPTRRQNEDSRGVLLRGGSDGGERDGLDGLGRARGGVPQLVVERRVADGGLGEETGLGHHEN